MKKYMGLFLMIFTVMRLSASTSVITTVKELFTLFPDTLISVDIDGAQETMILAATGKNGKPIMTVDYANFKKISGILNSELTQPISSSTRGFFNNLSFNLESVSMRYSIEKNNLLIQANLTPLSKTEVIAAPMTLTVEFNDNTNELAITITTNTRSPLFEHVEKILIDAGKLSTDAGIENLKIENPFYIRANTQTSSYSIAASFELTPANAQTCMLSCNYESSGENLKAVLTAKKTCSLKGSLEGLLVSLLGGKSASEDLTPNKLYKLKEISCENAVCNIR